MRNEIETKRNEIYRNETKSAETKRNLPKRNEIHRNETKSTETKRNLYRNEMKPTETKQKSIPKQK